MGGGTRAQKHMDTESITETERGKGGGKKGGKKVGKEEGKKN